MYCIAKYKALMLTFKQTHLKQDTNKPIKNKLGKLCLDKNHKLILLKIQLLTCDNDY
ncbi:hypothetical protein ND2E_3329 [Colwellia psychrerythraea]|uniref:Uncharacterized protein n=1 Tax=Colwellia psychrerythraea TaxID=28229 RepID=A0A099KKZ2_COLPS|nr:hypothetical protein ND2E_3329 [Colwellia psychrerythraea]